VKDKFKFIVPTQGRLLGGNIKCDIFILPSIHDELGAETQGVGLFKYNPLSSSACCFG
jgi:hypothetical protein